MAIVKQIGVVGAFVVALILGAPGTASAQTPSGSVSGSLYNVGDEPRANGGWTYTWGDAWDPLLNQPYDWMQLSVSCTKLTPRATYVFYVATLDAGGRKKSMSSSVVANRNGKAQFGAYDTSTDIIYLVSIEVYRVDGNNLVPVLAWPSP